MKRVNTVVLSILTLFFFSCEKYKVINYPSYYRDVEVYVDDYHYEKLQIQFVYNISDTNFTTNEISKLDTLVFLFAEDETKNKIRLYSGDHIGIIVKDQNKLLEQYYVDLIKDRQYLINPKSTEQYKVDTIQYGGMGISNLLQPFEFNEKTGVYEQRKIPPFVFSDKFRDVGDLQKNELKIDYWFTDPPDTVRYSYKKYSFEDSDVDFDPYKFTGIKKLRIIRY